MPYAIVEDKIAEIAPQYRGELLAFIDFLLYRQKNSVSTNGVARKTDSVARRRKKVGRTLGGLLLAGLRMDSTWHLISTRRWNVSRSTFEIPS